MPISCLLGSQATYFSTNKIIEISRTVYTCALNDRGGVEIDCTVTPIESGVGQLHDPIFKGRGYYIVAGGASMYHTIAHMRECISEKSLRAKVTDVTEEM